MMKLFLENNLELSELLINGTRMQEVINYQLGLSQNHILNLFIQYLYPPEYYFFPNNDMSLLIRLIIFL